MDLCLFAQRLHPRDSLMISPGPLLAGLIERHGKERNRRGGRGGGGGGG